MKLKGKFFVLTVIPLIILGIGMLFLASNRIADGIYDQAYVGMGATALSVRDIFETGNGGDYYVDENGKLWKGYNLNISSSTDTVDVIKEHVGMDVSIYWGNTVMLTTIVDENGSRQMDIQAPEAVTQQVLNQGNDFYDRDISILGTKYIVYYIPLYQAGSEDVVGMVFLGTEQSAVTKMINTARAQMLLVLLVILVVVIIIVFLIVNRITGALEKGVGLLDKLSSGNLNIEVDKALIDRKDEIGDVGRAIFDLRNKLRGIIHTIVEKSDNLYEQSQKIGEVSNEVYQVMEEVNRSAREMATSSTNQAEDANQAKRNVTDMGDMIGDNAEEVSHLSDISEKVRMASEEAIEQLTALNEVMSHVKEAIYFLAQQTALTGESVGKINSATELIAEIASQTNLLSLNASIEAARAGEHGRGFSVVATEIQQLADQSNTAAIEIKNIVNNLNENSEQAASRMEDVKKIVERQEEDINKTSEVFQNVTNGIRETVGGMQNIMQKSKKLENVRVNTVAIVQNSATAAQENSASIEGVMASVETVHQSMGDLAENMQFMNRLSQEMKESIEVFTM